MKFFKHILSLLFVFLSFFSGDLKADTIVIENEGVESFLEQDFSEVSEEKEWLGLLYLQEEYTSQDQIAFFGFSSGSLTLNFPVELCPKIYANDSQSGFQSIKKSGSHQGNGGWNEIVFNHNPDLVNSWKRIDDHLGDAGELVRKNPDALKQVDDAIKEGLDATDAIEDAAQTLGKTRPTWDEIKALFKRGNDYNRKGRIKYGDNQSEIVLEGVNVKTGKRLDAYVPPEGDELGQIISRKATDIDNITEQTWRNYCNELVTKYKVGTPINSTKMPGEPPLSGKYYLEIPASNQSAQKLESFKAIAKEYGTDNHGGIEIIFLAE